MTKTSLALLKMLLTRQRTILIVLGMMMTARKIETIKAKSSAKVSVLQTVEVTKKFLMARRTIGYEKDLKRQN
jgi:hypothetical protein